MLERNLSGNFSSAKNPTKQIIRFHGYVSLKRVSQQWLNFVPKWDGWYKRQQMFTYIFNEQGFYSSSISMNFQKYSILSQSSHQTQTVMDACAIFGENK